LKGWWQKLRLFRPGMFADGLVVFFDLDTIIVDDISALSEYAGDFATLQDFWRPGGIGSGVMLFRSGFGEHIWNDFAKAGFPQSDPRGDQHWLERYQRPDILQDMFPGMFHSYKTTCTNGVPAGARVVCFHGRPRPHEAKGWPQEYWEAECLLS
jgi:hypothetical protein